MTALEQFRRIMERKKEKQPAVVVVKRVPSELTEEELSMIMETCGKVLSVSFAKDQLTGGRKGYAFVAYSSAEAAAKAVKELHQREGDTSSLYV